MFYLYDSTNNTLLREPKVSLNVLSAYYIIFMQSKYNTKFKKLQSEFTQIETIYQELLTMKSDIQSKLLRVKEIYNNLISSNNKKRFVFCLDTFFFQYKTLTIGMENLNRYISLINNRMYSDYYKLYNIIMLDPLSIQESCKNPIKDSIKDSIKESVLDSSLNNIIIEIIPLPKKYPIYQDLELFMEYPLSDTLSIHGTIIDNIKHIFEYYFKKSEEIQEYDTNQIGISIDNFIYTLKYDNTLILEQLNLYIGYLTFFHKTQTGFLVSLLHKIQLFQIEIDENLHSTNQDLGMIVQTIQDKLIHGQSKQTTQATSNLQGCKIDDFETLTQRMDQF